MSCAEPLERNPEMETVAAVGLGAAFLIFIGFKRVCATLNRWEADAKWWE